MRKRASKSQTKAEYTCQNCGHVYTGKVCNNCGEKRFDPHQLSAGHFFHQIIDFFTHFESKVLKTAWLNFTRPGLVTRDNLAGIRVRYASPVQLYLVVSILFFLVVTKVQVTDYTPSPYDHRYFPLSGHALFKWARPIDQWVVDGIDSLRLHKYEEIREGLIRDYYSTPDSAGLNKIYSLHLADSLGFTPREINIISGQEARQIFWSDFQSHVGGYSKTLIFLTLPFIAGFIFLFFFRKLKMFGAAMIFATHFMVYNLCFFMIHSLVDKLPQRIFDNTHVPNLMDPFRWLFYNSVTTPFSEIVFGGDFEFLHLVFWMPWLFIAFRRLFGTPWWVNLLVSYVCGRVFFYLLFGVMKKFLIAFTIWTMH